MPAFSIQILKKYSSVKVNCSNETNIVFDSTGFNLYDNMFFSFDLDGGTLRDEIYIKFYDEMDEQSMNTTNENGEFINATSSSQTTKNGDISSIKKSYIIYKNKEKNFVWIGFYCKGTLTIENTKEENYGKNSSKIIIIIGIVFVIVLTAAIIITCIKRKKARVDRAARRAMRMQMTAGGYYPYPGRNMGMSVGIGMSQGYGSNYMMNNMPPQPGLIGSQPVSYSRMPNDATQNIEPNSPNPNENPPTSKLRIKRKKV